MKLLDEQQENQNITMPVLATVHFTDSGILLMLYKVSNSWAILGYSVPRSPQLAAAATLQYL